MKLSFVEVINRKLENMTEVWENKNIGIIRISEMFIDIDDIDVWLIDKEELFELVSSRIDEEDLENFKRIDEYGTMGI